MTKNLKNFLSAIAILALTFTVVPSAHASSTVEISIDCNNLQISTDVPISGGSNLSITLENCQGYSAWGGTSTGAFADYGNANGLVEVSGDENAWDADFGSGTLTLNLYVVGNLNETYNLNEAIGNGKPLFTLYQGQNYFAFIVSGLAEINPSPVLGKVNFDANSAKLTKVAKKKLRAFARSAIEAQTIVLVVEGFTARGSNSTWNEVKRVSLAKARANAVRNYLSGWLAKKELQHSISVKAAGSRKPIKPNDSEENRKKNRRVVVSFAPVG